MTSSGNDRILLATPQPRSGTRTDAVGGASADGEPCDVTEMSDTGGALVSAPESRFVVDALGSVLEGDAAASRASLAEGAEATSWAAVLRRLDVAGRALTLDAAIAPSGARAWSAHVAALAAGAGIDPLPSGTVDVLVAWSRGEGVPVQIDLTTDQVGAAPESESAWVAVLVLACLVDRSGFPPQVVA